MCALIDYCNDYICFHYNTRSYNTKSISIIIVVDIIIVDIIIVDIIIDMVSNDIIEMHNYAHYILRGIYYNYIHSETGIAISRFLIFVVFVAFVIYAKYDYLAWFILLICILEVYSSSMSTSNTPESWLNIWSEIRPLVHQGGDRDDRDGGDDRGESILNKLNKLTQGISLNDKEGFELSSILPSIPPITTADDRSLDYHTPNNFIKQSSQDFATNHFETKKCDTTGGIGSISMFGSNELIGKSRDVNFSSYDYSGKLELIRNQISNSDANEKNRKVVGSTDTFRQHCYNYFLGCVYEPIKRNDFRDIKKVIYTDIDTKIMSFDTLLNRFNIANLNTNDVSNNPNPNNYTVGNIIHRTDKNTNILAINDRDNFDFGRFINEVNSSTTDKNKNRKLEIYNNVYGYKIRLNEIFSGWRENAKRYNNDINLISISDTMLQELRNIVNYLRVIQITKKIIDKEQTDMQIYDKMAIAYTGNKQYLPYGFFNIQNGSALDIRILPKTFFTDFNSYKLYELTDTYNVPDEQRYLYGISYFYNNMLHP